MAMIIEDKVLIADTVSKPVHTELLQKAKMELSSMHQNV